MLKTSKLNRLAENDNIKLLDELCEWIDQNLDSVLGLQELVERTKLNNIDIQYLFEKYKQTSAMTYIRRRRENKQTYLITAERITPIFISMDRD
jgi:transcriptional regulator GlxA family with amidase domain